MTITKSNLSFGQAIDLCKNENAKISREGWNGKGMYVFRVQFSDFSTKADVSALMEKCGEEIEVPDSFALKTANDQVQIGWLASQADMMADDWCVVD